MDNKQDRHWMRQALALARRGWGRTSPNPMVGAVLVRGGQCVGRGWHRRAGTPHAEVHALRAAGDAACDATLYVTLEPCCTTGRTPPCTEALLAAGVRRVVVGAVDPNPRHAGRGLAQLRAAGVQVETGVEEPACAALNEAFFCWVTRGRPLVRLKLASTLDGRIATAAGESRWVSSEAARRQVHRLRQWADAILVGGETVRRDDPELCVRSPRTWWRQPLRLVWTRRSAAAFPRELRIWSDPARPPEFVAAQTRAEWLAWLEALGRRPVTSLLVEGGGELAASLLRAGVVDRVDLFLAPKLLGGRGSRPAVGGPDPLRLAEAITLQELRVRRCGADLWLSGVPEIHAP
jgi:diaminohydroxyphosphoribosylaminopyrimidine deaminase/5-amino-6-(5-phosphoribosylamino)uracil reductase